MRYLMICQAIAIGPSAAEHGYIHEANRYILRASWVTGSLIYMTIHWREDFEAPGSNGFPSCLFHVHPKRRVSVSNTKGLAVAQPNRYQVPSHKAHHVAFFTFFTIKSSVEDAIWKHPQCTKSHEPQDLSCIIGCTKASWNQMSVYKALTSVLLVFEQKKSQMQSTQVATPFWKQPICSENLVLVLKGTRINSSTLGIPTRFEH